MGYLEFIEKMKWMLFSLIILFVLIVTMGVNWADVSPLLNRAIDKCGVTIKTG